MMNTRAILIAAILLFGPASAFAQVLGGGSGPSNAGQNTFTNKNTFSGPKFSLSIDPTITGGLGAGFQETITVDPTGLSSPSQWNIFVSNLTLANGETDSATWQNFPMNILTTVTSGTATISGEVNVLHPYINNGAGVTLNTSEPFEESTDNYGVLVNHEEHLAAFHNESTGTVTGFAYGTWYQLNNLNTTAGAISTYFAINMEPMGGGGSQPTNYGLIRNNDPLAPILTKGAIEVGTLATNSGQMLHVQGASNTSSDYAAVFTDNSGSNIVYFRDDGVIFVPSGRVLDVIGTYQSNGTNGVSCAANTVNLTTEIVSGGLVTHC